MKERARSRDLFLDQVFAEYRSGDPRNAWASNSLATAATDPWLGCSSRTSTADFRTTQRAPPPGSSRSNWHASRQLRDV
jgi:hypothetical protein